MLAAVTDAISQVITWVGTVITALTGTNGALAPLLPLFAIGIAISAVLLGKYMLSKNFSNSVKLFIREYIRKENKNDCCRHYCDLHGYYLGRIYYYCIN